jgi:hypothetical protein
MTIRNELIDELLAGQDPASVMRQDGYRRLNTIFERSKEHLIAFVAIAFISILARRLKRLVAEELCV